MKAVTDYFYVSPIWAQGIAAVCQPHRGSFQRQRYNGSPVWLAARSELKQLPKAGGIQCVRIWLRNFLVRSSLGFRKNSSGVLYSTMLPSSKK